MKAAWDDNDVITQASLLAYDQIRERERSEEQMQLYKLLGARL